MKKIVLATSALFASAGFAAADVAITGSAEMGIVGGTDMDAQFHHDVDVTFTMSGETDNGLTFGATIDLDEVDGNGAFSASGNPSSVYLSGNFGTITMGDTDGALDWALTEAIIGGAIADNHEHAGYALGAITSYYGIGLPISLPGGNSGLDGFFDGQVLRYDNSLGDFAFAASLELCDDCGSDVGPTFGLGGKYTVALGAGSLDLGLGYQNTEILGSDVDVVGVSADASFDNGLRAIVSYVKYDNELIDLSNIGLALGYTMDALTVAVNYGKWDAGINGTSYSGDAEGWGLIANYDLGGGAEIQFGYGNSKISGTDGIDTISDSWDTYSLGIAMSF